MANDKGQWLNRDQVRYVCEEVAKVRHLPVKNPDGTPSSARGEGMRTLARAVGKTPSYLYQVASGRTDYARAWAAEWRAEKNGEAAHMPWMHKPHARTTEEQRALVRKLAAEGRDYKTIAKRTGIAKGSITAIVHGYKWKAASAPNLPAAAAPAPTTGRKPHKSKSKSAARPEAIARDIERFLQAACDKERTALAERHAREREELEARLSARKERALEQMIDGFTRPEDGQ